jgi:PAS domain S-box-containing protein
MTPTRIPRPRSIRAHLGALVAAILIPLIGLQIWSSVREYRQSLREAESQALTRAGAVDVAVRQFFDVSESVLTGIADELGDGLISSQCEGLSQTLDNVLDFVITVLVADASGEMVCSTRPVTGATVNIAGWERFEDIRREPFTVSEPVLGVISDTWIVAMAVPIMSSDDEFRGVLFGSVPLHEFQDLLGGIEWAPNELVTIASADRVVIARSIDPEIWVGQELPAEGQGRQTDIDERRMVARGPDFRNVDRAWGQVVMPDLGWTVFVGVPARDVYSAAYASAVRRTLVSLAVLLMALLLSSMLYRRISTALGSLVESTGLVLSGEGGPIPAGAPSEVREVLERFGDTLEARARAERSERHAKERYQSIFDNAVFGLYVSTPGEGFTQVNPALISMLGYDSAEALIEGGPAALYRDASVRTELLIRYENEGVFEDLETEWMRADGTWITVRLNGKITRNHDGVPEFEVIVEDVTNEKRREEEIRQAQKMEAVGRLAGGIAHDFNNLLTVIAGNTELVEADLAPDDPMRRDVEQIIDATDRASALTRQLLSFSRKESNQVRLVDLNGVVGNLKRMLDRLIGEDIYFETRVARAEQNVMADPGQLEQVIMNLVINARDALGSKGRILIETKSVENQKTIGANQSRGAGALLVVRDNGSGMDPETRSRVFEPFFTTKGEGEGTGLGLSTAYGIINSLGGQITVDSEVGVGTEFQIWLPYAEGQEEGGAGVLPDLAERETGGETILAVEDEDLVRQMVRRVLERAGYTVLTAGDGQEALELFDSHGKHIDLVLTDVVMPRVKGPELAERLALRSPDTPVLFMSGYTDNLLVGGKVMENPDLFLPKPFSPGELSDRVRSIIDRGAQA